jgi:hypothetical protein
MCLRVHNEYKVLWPQPQDTHCTRRLSTEPQQPSPHYSSTLVHTNILLLPCCSLLLLSLQSCPLCIQHPLRLPFRHVLYAMTTVSLLISLPIAEHVLMHLVIISTRGTGEIQGPSAGFRTMIRSTLSAVPNGVEYDTRYAAAFDQQSQAGTADVSFFTHHEKKKSIKFKLLVLTT